MSFLQVGNIAKPAGERRAAQLERNRELASSLSAIGEARAEVRRAVAATAPRPNVRGMDKSAAAAAWREAQRSLHRANADLHLAAVARSVR